MTTPLQADLDSVRTGANQVEQAKESVRAGFESFQAAVSGYADAFGGDEIGMLLGTAHQACVDAVTQCFSTNIVDLEDYVDCLHKMAEDLQAVDDEAANLFTRMLGSMG